MEFKSRKKVSIIQNFKIRAKRLGERVGSDLIIYFVLMGIYIFMYRHIIFFPKLISGIDFLVPADNAYNHLRSYFTSWSPEFLGIPTTLGGGGWRAVLTAFFVFISCGNQILAQKFCFASPLIASFAMYFFLSNHLTKSRPFAFTGALIFAYSPLIGCLNFGVQPLWGYALLPLLFNYMFNLFDEKPRRRDPLLFSLFVVLTSDWLVYILGTLPLILMIFFVLNLLTRPSKFEYSKQVAKYLVVSGVVYFVLVSKAYFMWVLSPSGGELSTEVSAVAPIERFFSVYSQPNADTINMLRLTATPSNFSGDYMETNPIGFILPVLVFLAALLAAKRQDVQIRRNVFGFIMIVIVIVLIPLSIQTHSPIFTWLYEFYPLMPVLRDVHSIMYPLVFAYSYLITYSLNETTRALMLLLGRLRKQVSLTKNQRFKLRRTSLALFLSFLMLICYFYYSPIQKTLIVSEPNTLPAPAVYNEIVDYMRRRQSDGDSRYFLVPLTVQSTVNLQNQYNYFFHGGFGNTQPRALSYALFAFDSFQYGETEYLGTLLAPANVKYVFDTLTTNTLDKRKWQVTGLVRRFGTWFAGDPILYQKALNDQNDLILRKNENFSDFAVYENSNFIPHLAVFSTANYVVGDRESLISLSYLPGFNISRNLLVFAEDEPNENLLNASSAIVFNDRDLNDLFMSFLVHDFGIDLWKRGANTTTLTSNSWLRSTLEGSYVWNRWRPEASIPVHARGFLTYGSGYIETMSNASARIKFECEKKDEYEIWLRPLYSPESTGNLTFTLDGVNLDKNIRPLSTTYLGFKWIQLGQYDLDKGEHVLVTRNIAGYNAIDELIVCPQSSRINLEAKLMNMLNEKDVLFLFNIKNPFFETEKLRLQPVNCDSMAGFNPHQGVFIPSVGKGNISLDSRFKIEGVASIKNEGKSDQSTVFSMRYTFNETLDLTGKESISFYVRVSGSKTVDNLEFALGDASDKVRRWLAEGPNKALPSIKRDAWNEVVIPLDKYSKPASQEDFNISAVKYLQFTTYTTEPENTCTMWIDKLEVIDPIPKVITYTTRLPKESYWSVAMSSIQPTKPFVLKIDDNSVPVQSTDSEWYESEPVFLDSGTHKIHIVLPETVFDRVAVYTGSNLSSLLTQRSTSASLVSSKISESEYKIQVSSHRPLFIVLSECYHPEWHAYVNGQELSHFPAFSLTNGFYIYTNGTSVVNIKFGLQQTHIIMVSVRVAIMVSLLLFVVYDYFKEKHTGKTKDLRRRETNGEIFESINPKPMKRTLVTQVRGYLDNLGIALISASLVGLVFAAFILPFELSTYSEIYLKYGRLAVTNAISEWAFYAFAIGTVFSIVSFLTGSISAESTRSELLAEK